MTSKTSEVCDAWSVASNRYVLLCAGAVSALSLSILGVVPPAAFGVKFGEVAAVARSESRVVVLEGELVPMPAMLCRDGWRLIDVAVVSGSPPEALRVVRGASAYWSSIAE